MRPSSRAVGSTSWRAPSQRCSNASGAPLSTRAASSGWPLVCRRVRTRLQRSGEAGAHELLQSGTPQLFEQRWLGARHYIEAEAAARTDDARMFFLGEREVVVPGRDLTGRMLQDGLDAMFGVCPWETLLTPTYRFFRLGPERERDAGDAPAVSRARAIAANKRPWWQFL